MSEIPEPLALVRGGVYRNDMGAELTAIEPLYLRDELRAHRIPVESTFGAIWLMEGHDELFGTSRHLATREGLTACGYQIIHNPDVDDEENQK